VNRLVPTSPEVNVVWFDEVDSTNAVAERLVEEWFAGEERQLPETVIVAGRQFAGRGRGGHRWVSPEGGLYATWIAGLLLGTLKAVPMAAGVSLAAAVEELMAGVRVRLKWPNDLLVDGRKLGGVLATSSSGGEAALAIVGFGINVGADPVLDPGDPAGPVSLHSLGLIGPASDAIWSLVHGFLVRIHPALEDSLSTRGQWEARSVHRPGELLRLRLETGVIEGRFVGFGSDGELELDVDGKLRRFSSGALLTGKGTGG
jgi:BirA family biotin operon repressor/biotin-[acetyl-CoA-carboxylase] ligase